MEFCEETPSARTRTEDAAKVEPRTLKFTQLRETVSGRRLLGVVRSRAKLKLGMNLIARLITEYDIGQHGTQFAHRNVLPTATMHDHAYVIG